MSMSKTVASFKNEPYETSDQLAELLKRELAYMNNISTIYVATSMNVLFIKYKMRSKAASLTKLQVDILNEYGYEFSHVNFAIRSAYFTKREIKQ